MKKETFAKYLLRLAPYVMLLFLFYNIEDSHDNNHGYYIWIREEEIFAGAIVSFLMVLIGTFLETKKNKTEIS